LLVKDGELMVVIWVRKTRHGFGINFGEFPFWEKDERLRLRGDVEF